MTVALSALSAALEGGTANPHRSTARCRAVVAVPTVEEARSLGAMMAEMAATSDCEVVTLAEDPSVLRQRLVDKPRGLCACSLVYPELERASRQGRDVVVVTVPDLSLFVDAVQPGFPPLMSTDNCRLVVLTSADLLDREFHQDHFYDIFKTLPDGVACLVCFPDQALSDSAFEYTRRFLRPPVLLISNSDGPMSMQARVSPLRASGTPRQHLEDGGCSSATIVTARGDVHPVVQESAVRVCPSWAVMAHYLPGIARAHVSKTRRCGGGWGAENQRQFCASVLVVVSHEMVADAVARELGELMGGGCVVAALASPDTSRAGPRPIRLRTAVDVLVCAVDTAGSLHEVLSLPHDPAMLGCEVVCYDCGVKSTSLQAEAEGFRCRRDAANWTICPRCAAALEQFDAGSTAPLRVATHHPRLLVLADLADWVRETVSNDADWPPIKAYKGQGTQVLVFAHEEDEHAADALTAGVVPHGALRLSHAPSASDRGWRVLEAKCGGAHGDADANNAERCADCGMRFEGAHALGAAFARRRRRNDCFAGLRCVRCAACYWQELA